MAVIQPKIQVRKWFIFDCPNKGLNVKINKKRNLRINAVCILIIIVKYKKEWSD